MSHDRSMAFSKAEFRQICSIIVDGHQQHYRLAYSIEYGESGTICMRHDAGFLLQIKRLIMINEGTIIDHD